MNLKERKPYTTEENLEMASMHEAAHATVALALGMPIEYITIHDGFTAENEPHNGYIHFREFDRTTENIVKFITINLASIFVSPIDECLEDGFVVDYELEYFKKRDRNKILKKCKKDAKRITSEEHEFIVQLARSLAQSRNRVISRFFQGHHDAHLTVTCDV